MAGLAVSGFLVIAGFNFLFGELLTTEDFSALIKLEIAQHCHEMH